MNSYNFNPLDFTLTRKIRIAIMLMLIVLFFAISPFIILYTMGYRYDFDNAIVKKTGVLSIDVEPRDARIFVNGIQINQRSPIRLTNRAPGTYRILIQKEGYKEWQKTITVNSNQTTYIRDIRLLLDTTPQSVTTLSTSTDFYGLPIHEAIAILEKDVSVANAYNLSVFNAQRNSFQTITEFTTKPVISVSPFSPAFFTLNQTPNSQILSLYDFKNPTRVAEFLFSSEDEIAYQWSKRAHELYLKIDNQIVRLDITGRAPEPLANVTTTIDLWYVEFPQTVWTAQNNVITLLKDPEISYSIPADTVDILDITAQRILLETQNGFTVLRRNTNSASAITHLPANDAYYHAETGDWWLWSNWEWWSVHPQGTIDLQSRQSEIINEIRPLDEYGLKLLMNASSLKALNPGVYPSQTLLEKSPITWVNSFPKLRKILFVETTDAGREFFELLY